MGLSLSLSIAVTAQTSSGAACAAEPAVVAAVTSALRVDAGVTVETLLCVVAPAAHVDTAIAEPGARIGQPVRFRLSQAGRYAGYAVMVPRATTRHARVTRDVRAGELLGDDDVEEVVDQVAGARLAGLPSRVEAIGQRLTRRLGAGTVLTADTMSLPPAVRSGDRVTIRTIVDGVEARGVATAQQSGRIGDVIRLVNPDTRRALRGRVIGKSDVEVRHGS